MGRKANPAVIGAFVLGAIALAVASVLVFGSGQLFKKATTFVCFFPGAVDGLNVGAPVRFKGVEIGSVKDIRLRVSAEGAVSAADVVKGIRIPVLIEIDQDKISERGGRRVTGDLTGEIKRLIDLGMRAQLNAQSLVTGLLFVQLDFMPDQPAVFALPPDSKPAEIPTVPTTLAQVQSAAAEILKKLEDLNLEETVRSVNELIGGMNDLVHSPALKATVERLPETVAGANRTLDEFRQLAVHLDKEQGPLIDSVKATSKEASATLEEARAALQSVQSFVNPNSPFAVTLVTTLEELSAAAREVRLLADELDRNPTAIIRGRAVTERK